MLFLNRCALLYCAVLLLATGNASPLKIQLVDANLANFLSKLSDKLAVEKMAEMESRYESAVEKVVESRLEAKPVRRYSMAHLLNAPMSSTFG